MEHKIGEIFEYNGEWYQALEKTEKSCKACYFYSDEGCFASTGLGRCRHYSRNDNKSVIFKKLEKIGEPTILMGKTVQEFKNNNDNHCEYCCFNKDCHPLDIASICDLHNSFFVEIKPTKEDMEENYKAEDTLLTRLVGKYVNNLIDYETFEKAVKELYSDKKGSKPTLKEFDLEAAKAGKTVCTRDGRKARIICFDRDWDMHIVALVSDPLGESVHYYLSNGKVDFDKQNDEDLMMLPEKKEGWININKDAGLFKSKEEAERDCTKDYVPVRVEFEI